MSKGEIKYKLVDGEPVCTEDDCPARLRGGGCPCPDTTRGEACPPGLQQQRDTLKEQIAELEAGRVALMGTATIDADHIGKLLKSEDLFCEQIATLKKQIAELEYQQEADTSTIGILASVVDVLWEDEARCEDHGYGDVVAKAKEVVTKLKDVKEVGMQLCEVAGFAAAALIDKRYNDALCQIKKTQNMNLDILVD